jgi:hypothetical protein
MASLRDIPEEGQHFTDQFKKPNHPTFSDESQYHGIDGNQGGSWKQYEDQSWSYTPSQTNLDLNGGPLGMQQYIQGNDPQVNLILPSN